MHSLNISHISLGKGVIICGAGPIGLIALAACRASGAHPLLITDLESKRLDFAKKYAPTCQTYQIDKSLGPVENAKCVREIFCSGSEYYAPDNVLECTGVESSIATASFIARRGGSVTVIGVGRSIIHNLPFMHLSMGEVRVDLLTITFCPPPFQTVH